MAFMTPSVYSAYQVIGGRSKELANQILFVGMMILLVLHSVFPYQFADHDAL